MAASLKLGMLYHVRQQLQEPKASDGMLAVICVNSSQGCRRGCFRGPGPYRAKPLPQTPKCLKRADFQFKP